MNQILNAIGHREGCKNHEKTEKRGNHGIKKVEKHTYLYF
jgi:hypothetical protein